MKYIDITNNPRIDNVSVSKAGTGLNLYYELDGIPYDVTGEFYIDRRGILHHEAEDDLEILVRLEF